ncbi:hypothetical protein [Pseudoalteromonas rubra]|uniref:Uncharacterized protein n=1 Tax=Pseudoalteromonas rubra TaxID=43658 RepID=A0A0U2X8T5_9GAMM|nr:hypothetical protein AT705_16075 [Pseudoalteromonas rubra]
MWLCGDEQSESERSMLDADISEFRIRLASISWFTRVLNEGIARRANKEGWSTGHLIILPMTVKSWLHKILQVK